MLLHLFSDANYNLLGFNATYIFSLCPGACGGHGRCDPSISKCQCHQGWGGPSCTVPMCSQACSLNGQCDKVRIRTNFAQHKYYSLLSLRGPWVNEDFCVLINHLFLLLSVFCHRKENAVSVIQAFWAKTASLVTMMTVEQGSGGLWVRETLTHLQGQVPLACICLPLEPCTCLAVSLNHCWCSVIFITLVLHF